MTEARRAAAFGAQACCYLVLLCSSCVVYTEDLLLDGPSSAESSEPMSLPEPVPQAPVDPPEPSPEPVATTAATELEPVAEPTPEPVQTSEPLEPEPVPNEPVSPSPEPEPVEEPDPTPDPPDECPDSDKTEPGECGCDAPDVDTDEDGTLDCDDECIDDPEKSAAGLCGCDVSDADGDQDGEPDCLDGCPEDPDKTEPGECGCMVPELLDDEDEDGAPDCVDECPADADKSSAGACGCGHPDTESDGDLLCELLGAALVHRYDFSGMTAAATDLIGDADGTVTGTMLSGGELTLSGTNQYATLPTSVLEDLSDLTIEAWVTWNGTTAWQRVFDFGSSDMAAGTPGTGTSYLFLTPLSSVAPLGLRAVFKAPDQAEVFVAVEESLPSAMEVVVAVVLDDTNDELLLHLDGEELASTPLTYALGDVDVVNTWIGRSQFAQDPGFAGSVNEFRVYSRALSEAELSYSHEQGPNPEYF